MTIKSLTLTLILTLLLAACGAASTPEPEPTDAPTATPEPVEAEATPELSDKAAAGKVLFETFYEDVSFSCATCHYVNTDNRLLGPGLLSIEDRFDDYDVDDETLEAYIMTAIVNPRVFIVPDESPYPENIMPATYGDLFTDDELDALVAYILAW